MFLLNMLKMSRWVCSLSIPAYQCNFMSSVLCLATSAVASFKQHSQNIRLLRVSVPPDFGIEYLCQTCPISRNGRVLHSQSRGHRTESHLSCPIDICTTVAFKQLRKKQIVAKIYLFQASINPQNFTLASDWLPCPILKICTQLQVTFQAFDDLNLNFAFLRPNY